MLLVLATSLVSIGLRELRSEALRGPSQYEIDLPATNTVFGEDGVRLHQTNLLTPSLFPFFASLTLLEPRVAEGFPDNITKVEDLFTIRVYFGDGMQFDAPTHLFGPQVNIIPYGDADVVKDAGGHEHKGDEVVSQYFPPGSVGFAIKHHRSFNRVLRITKESGVEGSTDDIKLQDTHVEIVVGVDRGGRAGVVTINNPQDYQEGGFGDEVASGDYPMIFAKPIFPPYVPVNVQQALIDNIRTMAVGFNTVSKFPKNYNGGDPLGASSPEKIRQHVKMMVQAVAGDRSARSFFERDENKMYCAELAFVAASAGMLVPLNHNTVISLGVSEGQWSAFKREVRLHNERNENRPSFFVKNNENKKIRFVRLADLDSLDALRPVAEYSNAPDIESQKLAFHPMTMADIVDGYLRLILPRKELGEDLAPYQAELLAHMKPGLLQMLSVEPESGPGRSAGQLFDEIVAVVGRKYPSYDEFRRELEPLVVRARAMTGNSSSGLFTPPSLFHLVLKGINASDGLLRLQYVGHGLHFKMVRERQVTAHN